MSAVHNPPASIGDFDRSPQSQALKQAWDQLLGTWMKKAASFPAWYDFTSPPSSAAPVQANPIWTGLPRTALLLNQNDVLATATTVEEPVAFGSGHDPLLLNNEPMTDVGGTSLGLMYRPQDEYLEWVTIKDADGGVREIWFTCEGPEYWDLIATEDRDLLVTLYSEITGIAKGGIDQSKLFFGQDIYQGNQMAFPKGSYNPYNQYNIKSAVHLTQDANSLHAEVALAKAASLLWGSPPKTSNPDLICCAQYGEANRFSDPTIGGVVHELARTGNYATLRDPVGLYIREILPDSFTDWNNQPIPNLATEYFTAVRSSTDGTLILRAKFKVPDGVLRNGVQARIGDLNYQGVPIQYGGQVADAINMQLFGQALPGAPAQTNKKCTGKACPDQNVPGFIVTTAVNQPCGPTGASLAEHVANIRPTLTPPIPGPSRLRRT